MRSCRVLFATLRAPFRLQPLCTDFYKGVELLHHSGANTSDWSVSHLAQLRIRFIPADPCHVSASYGREPLTPEASQLIDPLASREPLVKSINKWLRVIQRGKDEANSDDTASVEHFVGEVLHAADIESGEQFELLPQRMIRQRLLGFDFVTKPGFILREDAALIHLVAHECKVRGVENTWPQVGGQMLLAALRNVSHGGISEDFRMFGLRVVGTVFTFFRCEFQIDKLARLNAAVLRPDETFDIHSWGGERADSLRSARWGLDYLVPAERRQILDMLAAIAADIRRTRAANM